MKSRKLKSNSDVSKAVEGLILENGLSAVMREFAWFSLLEEGIPPHGKASCEYIADRFAECLETARKDFARQRRTNCVG